MKYYEVNHQCDKNVYLKNLPTEGPLLTCMTGPEKTMLGKIALFEFFGTTLCQKRENRSGARNLTIITVQDAIFLVPKPKPHWSEIRVK